MMTPQVGAALDAGAKAEAEDDCGLARPSADRINGSPPTAVFHSAPGPLPNGGPLRFMRRPSPTLPTMLQRPPSERGVVLRPERCEVSRP